MSRPPRLSARGIMLASSEGAFLLLRLTSDAYKPAGEQGTVMKCCRMSGLPQSRPSRPGRNDVTWLPRHTVSRSCEPMFIHSIATRSTQGLAKDAVFQQLGRCSKLLPVSRVTQKPPSTTHSFRFLHVARADVFDMAIRSLWGRKLMK